MSNSSSSVPQKPSNCDTEDWNNMADYLFFADEHAENTQNLNLLHYEDGCNQSESFDIQNMDIILADSGCEPLNTRLGENVQQDNTSQIIDETASNNCFQLEYQTKGIVLHEDRNSEAVEDLQINKENVSENVILEDNAERENVIILTNETSDKKLQKNNCKKRKRDPNNWKQNIRKTKRQRGESYINSKKRKLQKGRKVKESTCHSDKKCPFKCITKITAEERQEIHNQFWTLSDELKSHFYSKHVLRILAKRKRTTKEISRKSYSYEYTFNIKGVSMRVCQEYFLNTLNISKQRIYYFFKNIQNPSTSIPRPSLSGKHKKKFTRKRKRNSRTYRIFSDCRVALRRVFTGRFESSDLGRSTRSNDEKGLHQATEVERWLKYKMASTEIIRAGIEIVCCAIREEILKKSKKKNRNRRWWTRPWILRRNSLGASNRLLKELVLEDPESYRNHLRMDDAHFEHLLQKVAPLIQKKNTNMRESLSARLKLQIVLRFLATGDSYSSLSALYRVPKCSMSLFLLEVLDAIYEGLQDYIKVPSSVEDWKAVQNKFYTRWNFPFCCGALDGKHVLIRNPPHGASDYYNYKGQYSIVLFAAVDGDYRFIYIDVGTNGRRNDASIFNQSSLNEALTANALQLPDNAVFVADDAFPLRTNLLKPYSRIGTLSEKQKIFNYRLSRARRIVENAFGIMVSRFRIFERPIPVSLDKIDSIVRAACALHNWLCTTTGNYITTGMTDIENLDDGTITQGSWRSQEGPKGLADITMHMGSNNHSRKAAEVRDKFANYFSDKGSVPWQNRMIH